MFRKLCINLFPIEVGQSNVGFYRTSVELSDHLKNFGKCRFWDLNRQESSPDWILRKNAQFSEILRRQLMNGNRVLNTGGDHSLGIGTGHAFLHVFRKNPKKIVWIDAHADINTRSSSLSGNMHGMPVSFLMGLDKSLELPFQSYLHPEELIYIGIRDLDPDEWDILKKHKIRYFPMIRGNEAEILKAVGKDQDIHVSFDVDSLDPYVMPCTGTPVSGGLQLNDVLGILDSIMSKNTLRMVDLAEYNLFIPRISKVEQNRSRKLYYKTIDFLYKRWY
jgi:arginase